MFVQCQNTGKKYSAIFEIIDGFSGAQSQQGVFLVSDSDINIIIVKFYLNIEFN